MRTGNVVATRLQLEDIAELDQARGPLTRGAAIRLAIWAWLGHEPQITAEQLLSEAER
jgi:hypothetical protein